MRVAGRMTCSMAKDLKLGMTASSKAVIKMGYVTATDNSVCSINRAIRVLSLTTRWKDLESTYGLVVAATRESSKTTRCTVKVCSSTLMVEYMRVAFLMTRKRDRVS